MIVTISFPLLHYWDVKAKAVAVPVAFTGGEMNSTGRWRWPAHDEGDTRTEKELFNANLKPQIVAISPEVEF